MVTFGHTLQPSLVRVGGARPPPFNTVYIPSRTKLWCMLQLRGQIHSLQFYSTPICTQWGKSSLRSEKKQLIMQL